MWRQARCHVDWLGEDTLDRANAHDPMWGLPSAPRRWQPHWAARSLQRGDSDDDPMMGVVVPDGDHAPGTYDREEWYIARMGAGAVCSKKLPRIVHVPQQSGSGNLVTRCGRRLEPDHVDGSNASTLGGVFGRCDAAYVAIEFQKSAGSPHGHAQLFVQCLHQRGSLQEIFAVAESRAAQLREEYLRYNEHVRRRSKSLFSTNPDTVTTEMTLGRFCDTVAAGQAAEELNAAGAWRTLLLVLFPVKLSTRMETPTRGMQRFLQDTLCIVIGKESYLKARLHQFLFL
ncbi:unnamed protein product [Symbiodinium sp. KB8]|nr:unnamed protein product [Symbiodinium sp. KB8]